MEKWCLGSSTLFLIDFPSILKRNSLRSGTLRSPEGFLNSSLASVEGHLLRNGPVEGCHPQLEPYFAKQSVSIIFKLLIGKLKIRTEWLGPNHSKHNTLDEMEAPNHRHYNILERMEGPTQSKYNTLDGLEALNHSKCSTLEDMKAPKHYKYNTLDSMDAPNNC